MLLQIGHRIPDVILSEHSHIIDLFFLAPLERGRQLQLYVTAPVNFAVCALET